MVSGEPQACFVRRSYWATAEELFDAWLDPRLMRRWLLVDELSQVVHIEVDARPLGHFLVADRRGSTEVAYVGEYLELDPPRHLRFALQMSRGQVRRAQVTVDLIFRRGRYEMSVLQTGIVPGLGEERWREMLDRLNDVLFLERTESKSARNARAARIAGSGVRTPLLAR